MFNRFSQSNLQWHSLEYFSNNDKHLLDLKELRYIYFSPWINEITPKGVYTLFGSRQIGKTTGLKMFIKKVLEDKYYLNDEIFFLPCDTIVDVQELREILLSFIDSKKSAQNFLIILDEITFLNKWELTIKGLLDDGTLKNVHLIITGSDRILFDDTSNGFPGVHRRGKNGKDIIIHPLRFYDFYKLTTNSDPEEEKYENLLNKFKVFQSTGGYLSAINLISSEGIPRFIEVKWTEQTRSQDLKEIKFHAPAWVLTKRENEVLSDNIKIENLIKHIIQSPLPGLREINQNEY